MEHVAFTLLVVGAPISVVDCVELSVINPAASLLFTVLEIAKVDVPRESVDQATLATAAILLPASFVNRPVKLDQLSEPIPDELFVLPKVDVAVRV